jgi:hypothetical protein
MFKILINTSSSPLLNVALFSKGTLIILATGFWEAFASAFGSGAFVASAANAVCEKV